MTDPANDGDLRGMTDRLEVRRTRNGYLVTAWPEPTDPMIGEVYVAADRDELAKLVRRLMAEPPEGRVP